MSQKPTLMVVLATFVVGVVVGSIGTFWFAKPNKSAEYNKEYYELKNDDLQRMFKDRLPDSTKDQSSVSILDLPRLTLGHDPMVMINQMARIHPAVYTLERQQAFHRLGDLWGTPIEPRSLDPVNMDFYPEFYQVVLDRKVLNELAAAGFVLTPRVSKNPSPGSADGVLLGGIAY